MKFKSRHPHYEFLRKKWLGKHRAVSEKLLTTHGDTVRHLTLGGLGGLMLLTTPGMSVLPVTHNQVLVDNAHITKLSDSNTELAQKLDGVLPKEVRKLNQEEEGNVSKILSENFNLKTESEIQGIRLNRSYGLIGGEQHLYRYPGDSLNKHAESATEWAMFGGAGIAPGLGAWGYFTPSEAAFGEKDRLREKYYIAVQTFLAPGFAENVGRYRDFSKFRKMLLVNPKTGQGVVTVIGDAGPGEWTGKHLGGSPEVMHELSLAAGPRKGPVLYFFIDDPEDIVQLGPIGPK
ncbi:MAG: hypothetical protein Q7S88_00130 [Candidatus Daviesbacteria bacterium]|nr:hypothetical protein [Candidatus Daviesbacteria bacterium]